MLSSIVIGWAELEAAISNIAIEITLGDPKPIVAMFYSVNNTKLQRDMLNALEHESLEKIDCDILKQIMTRFESLAMHRNRFVHWLWGRYIDMPSGNALICNPKFLLTTRASGKSALLRGSATSEDALDYHLATPPHSKILVYSYDELEIFLYQILDLKTWLQMFKDLSFYVVQRNPDVQGYVDELRLRLPKYIQEKALEEHIRRQIVLRAT